VAALRLGLLEHGWVEDRNLEIHYRWGSADPNRIRAYAAELTALNPDVIFAAPSAPLAEVQRATRTIPVVFAQVSDPVGAGFVRSLAHPGGNITGFALFEFAVGAKWLELLKQIAPSVTRAAVIYEPATPSATGFLPLIQAAGRSSGVDVDVHSVHDTGEIEGVINALAKEPNAGLIAIASPVVTEKREFIVSLANRSRLPTIFALVTLLRLEVLRLTASIILTFIDARVPTSTASSRARSPATCQFNRRPNFNWSLI